MEVSCHSALFGSKSQTGREENAFHGFLEPDFVLLDLRGLIKWIQGCFNVTCLELHFVMGNCNSEQATLSIRTSVR